MQGLLDMCADFLCLVQCSPSSAHNTCYVYMADAKQEAVGPSLQESSFLLSFVWLQSITFSLLLEMVTGSSGGRGLHNGLGHCQLARKRTKSGDRRYLRSNSTAALTPLATSKSIIFTAAPNLFPLLGVNSASFHL